MRLNRENISGGFAHEKVSGTAEAVEKGTRRAYFRKIIVPFSPRKIIYNLL
jgi:hypothetical protein